MRNLFKSKLRRRLETKIDFWEQSYKEAWIDYENKMNNPSLTIKELDGLMANYAVIKIGFSLIKELKGIL